MECGIEWDQKGTHEKHLSVLDFEKKERAKEVAELEAKKESLEEHMLPYWKLVKSGWANWRILSRRFILHKKIVMKQINRRKKLKKKRHDMRKIDRNCSYGKGYGTICS